MTPDDMAATHARAFAGQGRAWSSAEFITLISSPHVFTAGDARAFALGRVIADEAEVLTLACDPAHQRRGLARTCLDAYEAKARTRGATTSFLEVAADNAPALALYLTQGYAETGRRAGYYPRTGGAHADALILTKTL